MKPLIGALVLICGATVHAGQVDRDIPFARIDGTELKLDLYHPEGKAAELIVWVHGAHGGEALAQVWTSRA